MKKFWKVVGVILLFVGIAYFGAEMEKREEYGHSGDSDFGLEDFLGIKKWPYQDHLFVNGKKNGDCKELKGNLLLAVIFVDENGNSWSSAEMETAKKEVYESSERLKREAASYGISIEMNHQFLHGSADQGIKKENQDAWVEQALSSVGFQNKDKVIKNLTSTYSATEAAVLFLVESEGRSFADTVRGNDDGFECVFLYADLGGDYLHELLHVFGARDFYYPDEISELAKSCFPESVMLNNNKEKTVDPLTAYLVGWTESPAAEAVRFLEGSATLTAEDLVEAYKEETKTGYGTVTRENGTYTGYLENGLYHGFGSYKWNDGASIIGNFSKGEPVNGTLTMPDGDKYVGEFKDWKRHGKGTYYDAGGIVLECTFENGKPVSGTQTMTNGDKYVGEFKDWKKHGKGTYTWKEGNYLKGTFEDGKPVSGTKTWTDGARYEGEFLDWQIHGIGTLTYPNGKVRTGRWANGKFVG